MSKRTPNGTVPRYFDPGYKTSYQKLRDENAALECELIQLRAKCTTGDIQIADLSARLEEARSALSEAHRRECTNGCEYEADLSDRPGSHTEECRQLRVAIDRTVSPSPVAALKDKVVEAQNKIFDRERAHFLNCSAAICKRCSNIAALAAAQDQEKP